MLPYTSEVFFSLFDVYNRAIWPAPWAALALALIAFWLTLWPRENSGRIGSAILALFWLWCGAVYHLFFFTSLNFWAFGFAALFILEALLLLWSGVAKGRLNPVETSTKSRTAGLALMLFALAGYPALTWIVGHTYPAMALIGVAPCPTVIFTLGFLLSCRPPLSLRLAAPPMIWTVIGGGSAWFLGIAEDLALIAALALLAAFWPRKEADPA